MQTGEKHDLFVDEIQMPDEIPNLCNGGMRDEARAYPSEQGGAAVEETTYGFHVVVHKPRNAAGLERRVAQAHADAIIARVKRLNCSAGQKKELIDAVCT